MSRVRRSGDMRVEIMGAEADSRVTRAGVARVLGGSTLDGDQGAERREREDDLGVVRRHLDTAVALGVP